MIDMKYDEKNIINFVKTLSFFLSQTKLKMYVACEILIRCLSFPKTIKQIKKT